VTVQDRAHSSGRSIPRDTRWLLLPALALQALLFMLPLAIVLERSLFDPDPTLANFVAIFTQGLYLRVLATTMVIGVVVTAVCASLGYVLAYFMAHSGRLVTGIILLAILVPLWTNLVARMFALQVVLGRQGFVNESLLGLGLIDEPLPLLFNLFSVVVGMVQALLPFVVLPCYAVMRNMDRSLVPAARSLGAGPFRAFRTVYLPMSAPGLVTGIALCFILAIGFVVTPLILGGTNEYTIGALITVQMRQPLNWGLGSALAITLLVTTAVIVYAYQRRYGLDRLLGGVR
jgi:ABC-type spermidine/putrescine transport system permease subunit I